MTVYRWIRYYKMDTIYKMGRERIIIDKRCGYNIGMLHMNGCAWIVDRIVILHTCYIFDKSISVIHEKGCTFSRFCSSHILVGL